MKSCPSLFFSALSAAICYRLGGVSSFQITTILHPPVHARSPCNNLIRSHAALILRMASDGSKSKGEMDGAEYRNVGTKVLSNFMSSKENMGSKVDDDNSDSGRLSQINFDAPKFDAKNVDLETFAELLDYELYESEWFVTGNVNPIYFSDDFLFQDPDVKVQGIEDYARGVNKIFDQATSRAEIISTKVNPERGENIITCTWRLSGKANIGPAGLTIKPYIVYTDFTIKDGLIVFQEDRFGIPQWDILVSSLFPFTIGKLTAPPAPPVEPRVVTKPKLTSKRTANIPWKFPFFG